MGGRAALPRGSGVPTGSLGLSQDWHLIVGVIMGIKVIADQHGWRS